MDTMEEIIAANAGEILNICNQDNIGFEKMIPLIRDRAQNIMDQLEAGDPE